MELELELIATFGGHVSMFVAAPVIEHPTALGETITRCGLRSIGETELERERI